MPTFFIIHPDCLEHQMTDGHPESPERLQAIYDVVAKPEFAALERITASKGSTDDLLLAHDQAHIDSITAHIPRVGLNFIDGDTSLCPMSGEAALRAAGAVIDAVRLVAESKGSKAFCAIRPPGHHAHRDHAAGFCLFNNVAIGALSALKQGFARVAIVDFDVHHGDGTQDIMWNEKDVLFISTHQYPLYPGTGRPEERGAHDNILNLPVPEGAGGDIFRALMKNEILPRLGSFKPDFLFVSAGFDAHRDDPLAGLDLVDEDYTYLMQELCAAADRLCEGRLVAVLEGGYNTEASARSVGNCLKEMMK